MTSTTCLDGYLNLFLTASCKEHPARLIGHDPSVLLDHQAA
ncbi:hypothetical protein EMEDMD4_910075 [Sinorhizobium medicae]|uniref:Uncharacterized protein n=1 Tax=Sinorhizobium medicae TaxID=110321 RepID=A0A508X7W5_9HYPH|nr:hypothetical protein EMEDMD4_910075 [Sinorhizobium medicae]